MKNRATILAIDDDESTQTVVKDFLEEEGYIVITSDGGQELQPLLERINPDIILIDVVLPDEDGLCLIRMIKEKTPSPVIVISEKDDLTDKVIGLEIGADDYLSKPLNLKELAARIKAHLRHVEEIQEHVTQEDEDESNKILRFGDWILDRNKLELKNASNKIAGLTTGEFQVLEALALSSNKVLSREKLFEITRHEDFESFDRAIDVQIARIRKKLGDDPRNPRYIKTVRGVGYMLNSGQQEA